MKKTMKNIYDPIQSVKDDLLERARLAKTILERIREKGCPNTIGLYGGWGTGKSSVLNLMAEFVKRSSHFHLEIIDAWKYEATGNILAPLITRLNSLQGGKVRNRAKRVMEVTLLFLSDMALRKTAGINLSDVADFRDEAEKSPNIASRWARLIDEIEKTNEEFRLLVDAFLKKRQKKHLIVCVDNLDRCFPDNALRLFESIKNLMLVGNCTWVFAIDDEVLARYVSQKYGETNVDGHAFIDKIINEQFHIPAMGNYELQELLWNRFDLDLNLKPEIDKINYLLTPRTLMKIGKKYNEFLERDKLASKLTPLAKQLLFSLIILYFIWPDFYKYLSSCTKEQRSAVLANFYEDSTVQPSAKKILLPQKFIDADLEYFLKICFIESIERPTVYIGNLNNEVVEDWLSDLLLRLNDVGLP
jgi:hypothetical protein